MRRLDLHTSPPPLQSCNEQSGVAHVRPRTGYHRIDDCRVSQGHTRPSANGLQKVLGSDNGPIAAAVINGRYTLTQPISALSFETPSVNVNPSGNTIKYDTGPYASNSA